MLRKAKMGAILGAMAAVLSVGSIGVYAATSDTTPAQTVKTMDKQNDKKEHGWGHGSHFAKRVSFSENADLLKLLNLKAEDLKAQIQAGKSLAEVAKAQGVSEDEVIKLLTEQQEAKLKERLAQAVKGFVENTHQGHERFGFGFKFGDNADLLKLLNLKAEDLKAQIQAGKSLAEVANAQGVSEDEVIKLLTQVQAAKLAEALKAGKLTQEQVDKMKENFEAKIKSFVEKSHTHDRDADKDKQEHE